MSSKPSDNVIAHVGADLRKRIEKAAEETGLSMSAWARFVLRSAVEQHEGQPTPEAEEEWPGEGARDLGAESYLREATYEEQLEAAAAAERARYTGEGRRLAVPERLEKLDPRDCPHHPQWRRGTRCTRCDGELRPLTGVAGRWGTGVTGSRW